MQLHAAVQVSVRLSRCNLRLRFFRASADVELHSDEESDAPDSAVASPNAAAEQQRAGLRIEQSSASDSDLSGVSAKCQVYL